MSESALKDTAQAVLQNLIAVARASAGAFFLIEEGCWVCRAIRGDSLQLLKGLQLTDEQLPDAAKALKSRRAVFRPAFSHATLSPGQPTFDNQHVLYIPLNAGNGANGVCLLALSDRADRVSKEWLDFLAALGRQSALAIANAKRLDEERADAKQLKQKALQIEQDALELQALYQISLVMSETLELKKLFPRVIEVISRLDYFSSLRSTKGGFFLIEGEQLELIYHTEAELPGFIEAHENLKLGQCLCGMAARSGEAVTSKSRDEPREYLRIPGVRPHEHVAVPLRALGVTIGVMCLYLPNAKLKLHSIKVLRAIGDQLGLAIANARLYENERRIADTLQATFLPLPPERRDLDVGLFYRSSSDELGKIGGDFYDFVELDDGEFALVIGDVSGRGLEAATLTATVKHMLRVYLEENLLPGHMLTRLNQAIAKRLDPEQFVTVGLVIIDLNLGLVSHASAGHPPAALISRQGKGRFTFLKQTRIDLPLGVVSSHPFQTSQNAFENGDLLVMYTDGLTEARSPQGKLFGLDRLIGAAQCRRQLPAQRVAEELIGEVVTHSQSQLKDDIALLVVKFARDVLPPDRLV